MKQSVDIPLTPLPTAQRDNSPTPKYLRRFHVMAKPIGSTCNIDCAYCYYLHKEKLLDQQRGRRMDDETLETFVRQYIEGHDSEQIVFSWQGGEPTMLGLDFFRKVIDLQAKYKPHGQRIENDLQTNGTLLNDDWCAFLKEHNFLIGLSLDGPKHLHDAFRIDRRGRPTFDLVMRGLEFIHKHGVKFNTPSVINRENAKEPVDVYRFLTREVGSTYVQFIPCVEPVDFKVTAPQFWSEDDVPRAGAPRARPGRSDSVVTDWSVDPDDWGRFLCGTFDEWVTHDLGRVLVNMFETAVAQTLGMPSQICVTAEICGKGLAIEHDGSLYACDHYVYPEYRLGHIGEHTLPEMVFSERQKAFSFLKRETLTKACQKCAYLKLCWGECPKNRIVRSPDGELGHNYLCPGIKRFHAHAGPMLKHIAASL